MQYAKTEPQTIHMLSFDLTGGATLCDVSFNAEGNASGTVDYEAAANQFLMQYHPHREGSPSLCVQQVMKGPIVYNTFQSFWGERWQKHNQNVRKHSISIRFYPTRTQ